MHVLKCHPERPVLVDFDLPNLSPAITVTDDLVLRALTKGSSKGGLQLRAQHLLDAVSGSAAPVAQDYLHQLTCLVNFLLLGGTLHFVPPWLCGAPITALYKKNGGIHPTGVYKAIRQSVSLVCFPSV